jgi:midasin
MKSAIGELESNLGQASGGLTPYFSEEFEVLCQYHDLEDHSRSAKVLGSNLVQMLSILADRPTRYLNSISSATGHDSLSKLMAYSGRYARSDSPLSAMRGSLPAQIIKKW